MDKVRELQRKLFMAAKANQNRRFHPLFDRIHRGEVLAEAWKRVRSNRGAPGVDGETLKAIEQHGVAEFLMELQADLEAGRYRPQPVRRHHIPKADGRKRPLGIPALRDRVVQMAAKIVLEPIYVRRRLIRLLARRGGERRAKPGGKPFNPKDWPHSRLVEEFSLFQLRGTIRDPGRTNAP